MDNDKLIEAAKLLQSYCKKHPTCDGCMFCSCGICELDCCPSVWQLPEIRRWTDADIALAKALKEFGATSIYKKDFGEPIMVYENGVDVIAGLRIEAFKKLPCGVGVTIDEIIAEGKTE